MQILSPKRCKNRRKCAIITQVERKSCIFLLKNLGIPRNIIIFAPAKQVLANMVGIVQLVRATDCGSVCRGFESHYPPNFFKTALALSSSG